MTAAKGWSSHSEGKYTEALGENSHAQGLGTVAQQKEQHVEGRYNEIDNDNDYAHIVGNGTSSKRENIYTLGWNGNGAYYGNLHTAKDLTVGGEATIAGDLSAKSMFIDTGLTVGEDISSSGLTASGGIFAIDNIVSMSSVHADFGDVIAQAYQTPENGYEEDESISLIQTGADAKEAKALAKENKARLDASIRNGVYTFGSYLNAIPDQKKQYGYLIKLYNEGTGSTKKNAYFTIKITGFSDGSGSDGNMPFDSTYQFYCYPSYNNNTGIVTKRSGVAFGKDFGELLVYRNEKDFYAFLPITANNLILNFEIISNKADLNPTITFGEKHETRQLEYSIATKYRLRNGSGVYAELVNNAAIAAGSSSHAEGNNTAAIGTNAHAEGGAEIITVSITGSAGATEYTLSSSNDKIKVNQVVKCGSAYAYITKCESNKITVNTTLSSSALTNKQATIYTSAAFGSNSHSEGYSTIALGKGSHSEGHETNATGDQSHSEGLYTNAKGKATHAEGIGTVATVQAQHVQGKYNVIDLEGNYAHIVGNGSSPKDKDRENIYTLGWNGNGAYYGNLHTAIDLTVGGNASIAGNLDVQRFGADDISTKDLVSDYIWGNYIEGDILQGTSIIANNDIVAGETISAVDTILSQTGNVIASMGQVEAFMDIISHTGDVLAYGSMSEEQGDMYSRVSLRETAKLAKNNEKRLSTIPLGLATGSADGAEIFNDSRKFVPSTDTCPRPQRRTRTKPATPSPVLLPSYPGLPWKTDLGRGRYRKPTHTLTIGLPPVPPPQNRRPQSQRDYSPPHTSREPGWFLGP